MLKIPLGEGLLTSEGDFWKKQRRISQPAFHRKRLALLAEQMTAEVHKTVAQWQAVAQKGETVDLAQDMQKLTTRIAAKALFSTEVQKEEEIGRLVSALNDCIGNKFRTPVPLPMWVPTDLNRTFSKTIEEFDRIIYGIIEERRASKDTPDDLLQMLMEIQDEETGERMNDKQLRDEVATLLAAGSETTASALVWTFYLLAQHKEAKAKVYAELHDVLGTNPPGFESLRHLSYLNQVAQESMRLYPPVWMIGREALADDQLGDFLIPKGAQVYICIYAVHRHPGLWRDNRAFIPERFANEQDSKRHKYSYFPFGGGPRVCIGGEFAKMELLIALAVICQNFDLQIDTSEELVMEPLVTLHPKNTIAARPIPR